MPKYKLHAKLIHSKTGYLEDFEHVFDTKQEALETIMSWNAIRDTWVYAITELYAYVDEDDGLAG